MFNRATNAETKWKRAVSARQAARFFFPIRGLSSTRFPEEVGETGEQPAVTRRSEAVAEEMQQSQQGLVTRDRPSGGDDPRTPSEALQGPKSQHWKEAMGDEFRSLVDNDTWELVELPLNRKAIGCKRLFKSKRDENGNVVRHKARLVAQGFTQKFGVDFDEVFAPVAKQVSLRTLLTIASRRGMIVKHVDVKTAYLHGILDETIYMKQPDMYHTGGANVVCRLKRSIYGLKQSARVWNQRIDGVFKSMQFVPSKADPCLYVRKKGNRVSFILIYVDDVIIATQTEEEFERIFEVLQKNFTMTNLGDVKHFLGIDIKRKSGSYTLCQQQYIRKLAERFGLQDAKPSKIPLDPAYLQQKEEEDCQLPNNSQYLSLIGGLLYVSVNSRPDVSVSVSILAQKCSCPTQRDWQEAKRILRYLNSTSDHRLHLGSTSTGLEMFVDADWASNHRHRKSNSGYLVRYGGGLISWASRKQSCVALSSTEAEFVALTEGCQELSWIKKLLKDFGEDVSNPVPTYEDNQSCIKLVEGDKIEKRSKHIDTKFFYVRELNEEKEIMLKYCPTEMMLADILTKPLHNVRIKTLREKIGILPDLAEEECGRIKRQDAEVVTNHSSHTKQITHHSSHT